MSHTIRWTRPALKDLRDLDESTARRIHSAVETLASEGRGDVRRLTGVEKQWRLRVGSWRVRFTYLYEEHALVVLRVVPRNEAYR